MLELSVLYRIILKYSLKKVYKRWVFNGLIKLKIICGVGFMVGFVVISL
jgi:hypothetical protein